MKTSKLKVIIAIFACLIVVILGLVQQFSIERLAYTMLIVVVVFYVFGIILQTIVNRIIKENTPETEKVSEDLNDIKTSEVAVELQQKVMQMDEKSEDSEE